MVTALPCEHCMQLPTFKHVEQQQHPYRGLWQGLVARVTDMPEYLPIYRRELDTWLAELWDAQPDAAATFAVNTTRYDRPLEEITRGMQ
jgi:hypothetical protein